MLKSNSFVYHIREYNQKLTYCEVNAHHKNGAAERVIKTVSECARAQILHATMHWKDVVSSELCPITVYYTVYLYNHLTNEKVISPADLFTGVTYTRHKLKYCHI